MAAQPATSLKSPAVALTHSIGTSRFARAVSLTKPPGWFISRVGFCGRSLGQSVDAYNSAVGSLERQVLPGARKFTELGLRPGKEIDEIAPVEKLAREPRLPEADASEERRDDA